MDQLRFIACGSVDDGKSTLIGRLLWETGQIFADHLVALEADSKKYGTQGADLDFALPVDGLAAEREQGITIDVAHRYFSTPRRKFIAADTPGHEQYTRNMITGASTASAAVLLLDARKGLLQQTRRHAYLVSLAGIRNVCLAVNKMDLLGFEQATYTDLVAAFEQFAKDLNFANVQAIPMSALKGDNVVRRSDCAPWYSGPSLLEWLETVDNAQAPSGPLRFPVQWVSRPSSDFRGYAGTVASGRLAVGDALRVTSSGQAATVSRIVTMDGDLADAQAGRPITLVLDRELDVSRGDVLSAADAPVQMTDQFEAAVVWMHAEPGFTGRVYEMKLASQWAAASITNIKYRVDVATLEHVPAKSIALNEICVCNISTNRPLCFDAYTDCVPLGSFILVDRETHATVAAGMIRHNLRRSQNVHPQPVSIGREHHEALNGHRGAVVWFTGLSGSGKSTLANHLEVELHRRGVHTFLLDGDNVRRGLNKDLGFTDADRIENIRRVAELARLMADAGLVVLTAFISPFRQERAMARELIGSDRFVEVHVAAPIDVCEERDPKGLYKKARAGAIPNMTGINSPYEEPESPEVRADTAGRPVPDLVGELLHAVVRRIGPGQDGEVH